MKRKSGVLMHISSLPSGFGTGDFGRGARLFADVISDCGFTLWQTLPFTEPDECFSPYKSWSAFAPNPFFISPEILFEKGLMTRAELTVMTEESPYSCEIERLFGERMGYLREALGRADAEYDRRAERFESAHPRLAEAALFAALRSANRGAPWPEWKTEEPDEEEMRFRRRLYYEFYSQWEDLHAYCGKKGIEIIGDIPIYVSYDSADVYFNKSLFQLDRDGRPTKVAGVPPDYFSDEGQLWGNPLYDIKAMRKDGFSWWRERVRGALEIFDGVRIDHFRGFESFWSVPADAASAKSGKWQKGGGRLLIDAIKSEANGKTVIAEDLGDITDKVRRLVDYSGFPGMRVLQFAFLGDKDSPHLPHNYENNCFAYTGTHDNNTLLGYMWESDEKTRADIAEYFGYPKEEWNSSYLDILRSMLASHAGSVIFPIQDILMFGADTRMNTPGTSNGNWRYRVTASQLETIDRKKFHRLNELYGRLPEIQCAE